MAERVIWERTVDHDRIERRTQRFLWWFGIPAGLCLLAGLIFAGWANTIGIAIVLGVLGLGLGTWVRFTSLSEQANPVIVLADGELVLGRRSVAIADIKKYTTFATSVQTSLLGDRSRLDIGKALFRLDDGSSRPGKPATPDIVEFPWPKMGDEGIATVKEALEPVLPGRWVPPDELIDEDELPPPRRPSQRLI